MARPVRSYRHNFWGWTTYGNAFVPLTRLTVDRQRAEIRLGRSRGMVLLASLDRDEIESVQRVRGRRSLGGITFALGDRYVPVLFHRRRLVWRRLRKLGWPVSDGPITHDDYRENMRRPVPPMPYRPEHAYYR